MVLVVITAAFIFQNKTLKGANYSQPDVSLYIDVALIM